MRSRVVNMTIPADLIRQIDEVARAEGRTRSELVREAARRYVAERHLQKDTTSRLLSRLASLASAGPKAEATDLDVILYGKRRSR